MNTTINSSWIKEGLVFRPRNVIQISIVAYEYPVGMPARFCAGLIPAIKLSRQLRLKGFESIVRIIDPTPIAYYCNGWQTKQSQFRDVITEFLDDSNINFFFDGAEQVCSGALELLSALGAELESSTDEKVIDIVQRIKESGRRHGGELGANNATLYMAAHPFSWLDMYHPLIWKKSYSAEGFQFVNLMSKSEKRFTVIREFLRKRRPELCTTNNPTDRYMTICDTPCYVPLEGEPMFVDLRNHGYDWCHNNYYELRKKSSNHRRAYKDFEALMSFLGIKNA